MNEQTQLQTIVVHLDQLTPENMLQLGQAGYRVLRDPNFLIFARQLPPQDIPNGSQDPSASLQGEEEEVIEGEPISIPARNRRK